jgi:hypothetical protein
MEERICTALLNELPADSHGLEVEVALAAS